MSAAHRCVPAKKGRAALAKVLAERGVRVLVFERETSFRDRVRGEQMHPWGVAEARKLGLYELLLETCGSEARYWDLQLVRRFRNNGPMASCCIIDFVAPSVDDGLAIDVGNKGHQAFPEFVFGADADVTQHRTCQLGEEALNEIEP